MQRYRLGRGVSGIEQKYPEVEIFFQNFSDVCC